jgi:hypothetical protein
MVADEMAINVERIRSWCARHGLRRPRWNAEGRQDRFPVENRTAEITQRYQQA